MKKVLGLLGLVVAMSVTSCTTADSAEVALVVDQIGNDKGTPNIEMASGFIFYFPPTPPFCRFDRTYPIGSVVTGNVVIKGIRGGFDHKVGLTRLIWSPVVLTRSCGAGDQP